MPNEPLPATILVIFGITGDLAHRKLLPALYYLAENNLLPLHSKIVGITRHGASVDDLIDSIRTTVTEAGDSCKDEVLEELRNRFEIVTMGLVEPEGYIALKKRLNDIENEVGTCMSRLYYLAIPSQAYEPVIQQLGQNGLNEGCQHGVDNARLLIEKPFGYDLASAEELINKLNEHFTEKQIYRIDHYLAKETAQNILAFRFGNPIFKRIWDHQSISGIIVSATESIGIEGRTVFYEQTGALRDFVQSHLLQLLSLIAMEEPAHMSEHNIHEKKLALLQAVEPIAPNAVITDTVRGQYDAYKQEVDNPDSFVETYAALRLQIRNDRWHGVPILLRVGKALKERRSEIVVFFSDSSTLTEDNVLTIQIQPQEGVILRLLAKRPGFDNELTPVDMDFDYSRSFAGTNGHPDAYERVLVDAIRAEKTLFATSDEVLASWRIIENVIHEWAKNGNDLEIYPTGSWGPDKAVHLIESINPHWPYSVEENWSEKSKD
jgi:glucose-6-phosphate 1-dehydrogenase